jgi:alpha-D-ribose 1-methylphosphonate 5-triphosphate diphosphatase
MIIEGGLVLLPEGFVRCDIGICEGMIVDPSEADGNRRFRADGMHVLPGIIDIHGDAFERQIMPRPGVSFDHAIALMDTDRQLAINGITTAYHGITLSWEPGLRSTSSAISIIGAIERLRPSLAVDTRIHLRHETFHLDAEPMIIEWLETGRINCLAFNDHTSGTILVRHRPDNIVKMAERSGLTHEDFMDLVERIAARKDEVMPSLVRLAAAAVSKGVPLLSHDDMSPAMRAGFRALGSNIAEFPIDAETSEAAASAADHIVFGAPNVLRGGSHTGCPSAREMIERQLCTILASDYYYPSLVHAPYLLQKLGIASLEKCWELVSKGPAAALGLTDRGSMVEGMRADIIVVDPTPASGPAVMATLVGGKLALSRVPVRISA